MRRAVLWRIWALEALGAGLLTAAAYLGHGLALALVTAGAFALVQAVATTLREGQRNEGDG